ncbi:hypothetical protein LZ009_05970 [Ramlibacter sp. XY19]|uniref:hypothetical protein n=1 Tax=Ramlibacter paludis TaxID=2908000 RepID=UPI0023DCB9B1|nr:hypothetical protein [Ramlibacter paludis]MCG2592325.1 hypothetical protein [Ramlibacter paludis]
MKSLPARLPLALAATVAVVGFAGLNPTTVSEAVSRTVAAPAAVATAPMAVAAAVAPANPLTKLSESTQDAVRVAFANTDAVREKIKWVPVNHAGEKVMTPDAASRLLLAKFAAERAGLQEVGLNYQDVYGLIMAETSWVPRTGMGKNGTRSYGLAQFEPGTAKGVGLKNPNDPVEAVYAAALHMKHAAEWSADKLEALKLPPQVYATKLREGVSVYYNLSWKGRKVWDGVNTAALPEATQRHIKNTAWGAQRAEYLEEKLASEGGLSS